MSASVNPSDTQLDLTELGTRLSAARIAMSLTVDEIAQRLHLPLSTVTDLEAGRSQRIGTAIYLRGFLRSYLKLLSLPEAWAEIAMAASSPESMPPILPAAGAVARRVPWIDRYKWAASYVVGTALALTAVHWLVSNTPQLGFPDAPRSASVPTQAPSLPPPAPELKSVPEASPGNSVLGPVAAVETNKEADDLPVMASLNPFRVPGEERAAPVNSPVLTLVVVQTSWVDVRDRNGAKLLYQTMAAGETRSFSEGAPFSVQIGDIRGVRVDVAGTAVDLGGFSRGNVARFSVIANEHGWTPIAGDKDMASRDDG